MTPMRKILYTTAHALPETDVGYDLGRSTSNNLSFEEVLDDAFIAELRESGIGYGSVSGDEGLREAFAGGPADRAVVVRRGEGGPVPGDDT